MSFKVVLSIESKNDGVTVVCDNWADALERAASVIKGRESRGDVIEKLQMFRSEGATQWK